MIAKLMLPFPLLSDPRGDLAKRYGLWNEEEGVAIPAIIVVDRSGEIRHLYEGTDFADRPPDEAVFGALDNVNGVSPAAPEEPEIRVTPAEAYRDSVRPNKSPMSLEDLLPYYRGVFFATKAFKRRFGEWGRRGKDALEETERYQDLITGYDAALKQTIKAHNRV